MDAQKQGPGMRLEIKPTLRQLSCKDSEGCHDCLKRAAGTFICKPFSIITNVVTEEEFEKLRRGNFTP